MFVKLLVRMLAIFCMIASGALARKLRIIDAGATQRMARVLTNFFYPSLIVSSIIKTYTLPALLDNWLLPAGAVLIMATGYFWGLFFSRLIDFSSDKEKHQFLFQCAINNYSFLPLPIILMLWGEQGVAWLIFSSLGSEISVWTFGVFALTGNRFRRDSLRQLLNAPMLAIFFAVLLVAVKAVVIGSGHVPATGSFPRELAGSLLSAVDLFGKGTIPLAMFLVGSRMAELKPENILTLKQCYLVSLRLLVIPAAACALLFLLPMAHNIRLILLVVAVMPSAIASVVLSEVYDSDSKFAASSVLTTHLLSILTIPAWLSLFLK